MEFFTTISIWDCQRGFHYTNSLQLILSKVFRAIFIYLVDTPPSHPHITAAVCALFLSLLFDFSFCVIFVSLFASYGGPLPFVKFNSWDFSSLWATLKTHKETEFVKGTISVYSDCVKLNWDNTAVGANHTFGSWNVETGVCRKALLSAESEADCLAPVSFSNLENFELLSWPLTNASGQMNFKCFKALFWGEGLC